MTDVFLRFTDEAEARATFLAYGYAPDEMDGWRPAGPLCYEGGRLDYVVVNNKGTIYRGGVAVAGYHVNLRWVGAEDQVPDFGDKRVHPVTPECVFAGSPVAYLVPDYFDGANSWTDNTRGLLALLDEGTRTGSVTLPTGCFAVNSPVELLRPGLNLQVIGAGTEIVVMDDTVRSFMALGAPDQSGQGISLSGSLTIRQGRPSQRTTNVQLLNLRGCRRYTVDGITIPSAHNMGLTIGVGDPSTYVADEVHVRNGSFGGKRYVQRHSSGSIGDTAVWIRTPGLVTRIEDNSIVETGDDAIFIGHNNSGAACDIEVNRNDCRRVSGGIGTSFPGVKMQGNYVEKTVNGAYRFIDDFGPGFVVSGTNGRGLGNRAKQVGFLTVDELWADALTPQLNPYVYRVGSTGCEIEDTDADITVGTAIRIDPGAFGPFTLVLRRNRYSRVACENSEGLTLKAFGSKLAVYRRADSGVEATSILIEGDVIEGTNQPICDFFPAGTATDHLTATVSASGVDFTTTPLAKVTATEGGRSYMTITAAILDGSPVVNLKSVSGGASTPADVSVTLA